MPISTTGRWIAAVSLSACSLLYSTVAQAAERILLSNGFSVSCDHRGTAGDGRVRLFLDAGGTNFLEVESSKIIAAEQVGPTAPASSPVTALSPLALDQPVHAPSNSASLHQWIKEAGASRNVAVALLESVVQAESGGHARAVSRTGARGLMQLMPGTARALGVQDSFAPEQNLRGGTAYLDQLLTRYHDNIALALAAYNAGPGAVDRYRGIPPYRETQAYVARIIHEFNRRTLQSRAAQEHAATAPVTGAAVQP